MSDAGAERGLRELLAEQQRYYRARARRYEHSAPVPGGDAAGPELVRAVVAEFDRHVHGDVLELACGPGTWTSMLADRADSVTALDGAPEMLAVAAAARPGRNVRFVEADIFNWRPDRRYDTVFFGFWLSHVPEERFDGFWITIADCLKPGGRVLFADDAYRAPEEWLFGAGAGVVARTHEDGTRHRIVKMPHTAAGLERRLTALGWTVQVRDVGPFFWGTGSRSTPPGAQTSPS